MNLSSLPQKKIPSRFHFLIVFQFHYNHNSSKICQQKSQTNPK